MPAFISLLTTCIIRTRLSQNVFVVFSISRDKIFGSLFSLRTIIWASSSRNSDRRCVNVCDWFAAVSWRLKCVRYILAYGNDMIRNVSWYVKLFNVYRYWLGIRRCFWLSDTIFYSESPAFLWALDISNYSLNMNKYDKGFWFCDLDLLF